MRSLFVALALVIGLHHSALAQYTRAAGQNAPMDPVAKTTYDKDGYAHTTVQLVAPKADAFGNAQGNDHDLAVDGAFKGQTVAVIQLYTGEGFDFSLPRAALAEKGFSVFRWSNGVPTPADLEKSLQKCNQLWIISGSSQLLTEAHLKVIKKFFDAGHGVYIWGDNEPYYADANFVAQGLLGTTMTGDVPGDRVVGVENTSGGVGLLPNHLLTTGLEHIYEGITIATIAKTPSMSPLIYGSADNLVAAYYDHDGKRAILDGGFTRLYLKWDTAGTARYVKNAGAWLANAERFGDTVVAVKTDKPIVGVPVKSVPAIATPSKIAPPVASKAAPTLTVATHDDMPSSTLGLILIAVVLGLGLACLIPLWWRSRV
jgi:hypothetical protein